MLYVISLWPALSQNGPDQVGNLEFEGSDYSFFSWFFLDYAYCYCNFDLVDTDINAWVDAWVVLRKWSHIAVLYSV